MEHIVTLDVVLANQGQKVTYIDITFVRSPLIRMCAFPLIRKSVPKVTGPKRKDNFLNREALSGALQTLN